MKIMICGSMAFAKEMRDKKGELARLGHRVKIPVNVNEHLKNPHFVEDLEENLKHCIKNKTIKRCFNLIAKSDAVLVVNYKRNGIDGYIGVSALMEMGIAHHFHKKIFIFNKIPHFRKHRFAHEVTIMQPIVINGDLRKIE